MTIDPQAVAGSIVNQRYGCRATIQAISRLNTFVFRLVFDDRPAAILKMSKSSDASLIRKELAVIEALRRTGIAVAPVEFASLGEPLPYMILTSAGDTTVVNHLNDSNSAPELVEEMGTLLARVHTMAEPPDFLPRQPGMTVDELYQLVKRMTDIGILARHEVDAFKALEVPVLEGKSLSHGDFHAVNCIVQKRHISAIVDWGAAWIGNPFVDLAVAVAYFDYYAPPFAPFFLEAYRRINPLPEQFEDRYLAVRIAHAIGLIHVFSLQQRRLNVSRALELLRGYLVKDQTLFP